MILITWRSTSPFCFNNEYFFYILIWQFQEKDSIRLWYQHDIRIQTPYFKMTSHVIIGLDFCSYSYVTSTLVTNWMDMWRHGPSRRLWLDERRRIRRRRKTWRHSTRGIRFVRSITCLHQMSGKKEDIMHELVPWLTAKTTRISRGQWKCKDLLKFGLKMKHPVEYWLYLFSSCRCRVA